MRVVLNSRSKPLEIKWFLAGFKARDTVEWETLRALAISVIVIIPGVPFQKRACLHTCASFKVYT